MAVVAAGCLSPTPRLQAAEKTVFIIPIEGMIERALVYVVRRGVTQALRENADALILDMNTPGGRLDATEEIINLISDIEIDTYTFVNRNAISAGAMISLATDTIYMAPGGRIGDAMPIMMSPLPFGGAQDIPEGLKEKAISPTVALIRSAAQRNGHDEDLAEAMVRPEFEYKIGDEIICPSGELLTLTSADAERRMGDNGKPLLSQGTVADLDALLELLGHGESRRVIVQTSATERVARVIEGFPISGLLLAGGLLLLYLEFKSPGFGVPGILGLALLGTWFWGHHIAGLAGSTEMLIFLLGIVLLLIELFVIPGFGGVGLAGLSLILLSLIMAMIQPYPGQPWYRPSSISPALAERMVMNLGVGLLTVFTGGILLARLLPHTRPFRRLMLETATTAESGYRASDLTPELVGQTGVTLSALRPSGIGLFGERRLDVTARGAYLEKGTAIVIAETHGSRVIVEPADQATVDKGAQPA